MPIKRVPPTVHTCLCASRCKTQSRSVDTRGAPRRIASSLLTVTFPRGLCRFDRSPDLSLFPGPHRVDLSRRGHRYSSLRYPSRRRGSSLAPRAVVYRLSTVLSRTHGAAVARFVRRRCLFASLVVYLSRATARLTAALGEIETISFYVYNIIYICICTPRGKNFLSISSISPSR